MADSRINLLSSASSSASDDFFVVDGTTNGTRKLSAFSPTFGGNATVTGTLTSNGSFAATGSMVSTYGTAPQLSIAPSGGRPIRFNATLGNISIQANSGGWYLGTYFLGSAGTHRGSIWAAGTDDSLDFISIGDGSFSQWLSASSTKIAIPLTTASTTTSTGALVVGNGTSGGLGVGGAIFAGGAFNTPAEVGIIGSNVNFNIVSNATNGSVYLKSNGGTLYLNNTVGNGDIRLGNTGTVAYVIGTAASTSTSSGALVVSGGVGVAGAQYLGVKLNISTHDSSTGGIGFGTETNLYRYQAGGIALDHASGAAPGLLFRENGSSTLRLETNSGVGYLSTLTSSNLILRTNATTALTLDTSQNAIFAGTIRTAAPVGGTAASWKLGTVATVSPTSPNRTIEVDIGGTIYYLAAKTTNN